MNILSVKSYSSAPPPAFKARLFDPQGNQVKGFCPYEWYNDIDAMSKRGNKNTDIYIQKFISKRDDNVGFINSAMIKIENPLFGAQEFIQQRFYRSISRINGDPKLENECMDVLTGKRTHNSIDLENKALRNSLIEKIRENVNKGNDVDPDPIHNLDINPVKILENMFAENNPEKLNFDESRIRDFKNIAQELLVEVISGKVKIIKDWWE